MILRRADSHEHHEPPAIEPLTPEVAASLRLSPFSRFTPETLANHARQFPGLSWVIPSQRAYAVGGYWRLRKEIGEVVELSPGAWRHVLFDRLLEGFRSAGMVLAVVDYDAHHLDNGFFASKGFRSIERIVEYERLGTSISHQTRPRAIRHFEPSDLEQVLEVERESFPWLWWNSREDLVRYVASPQVRVLVDVEGDRVIGYAGVTIRGPNGHLDRLAVRESRQGEGIGAALLAAALGELRQHGVRRVSLSTQETNRRSQALYERFGFVQSKWRYDVYGLWLTDKREAGCSEF